MTTTPTGLYTRIKKYTNANKDIVDYPDTFEKLSIQENINYLKTLDFTEHELKALSELDGSVDRRDNRSIVEKREYKKRHYSAYGTKRI